MEDMKILQGDTVKGDLLLINGPCPMTHHNTTSAFTSETPFTNLTSVRSLRTDAVCCVDDPELGSGDEPAQRRSRRYRTAPCGHGPAGHIIRCVRDRSSQAAHSWSNDTINPSGTDSTGRVAQRAILSSSLRVETSCVVFQKDRS